MEADRLTGLRLRAVEITPGAAPRIAAIWRRAWWSARPDVDAAEPIGYWLGRVQAEFVSPCVVLTIDAPDEEAILAFMAIEPHARHIAQLFVDVPFQGRGLGRLLLDEACRRMPDGWGLHVATKNHRAQDFYVRYGLRRGEIDLNPATGRERVAYTWTPESRERHA